MKLFQAAVGAFALAVLLVVPLPSAHAAENTDTYCLLSPIVDSAVATASDALGVKVTGEPVCVEVPGGVVVVDEATGEIVQGKSVVTDSLGTAIDPNALGREYKSTYFGGSTLTWLADTADGCRGERSYGARSMPKGWKDNVSSAQAFGQSQCFKFYHYEHAGYGGAVVNCWSCYETMGVMDDATSSVFFTR